MRFGDLLFGLSAQLQSILRIAPTVNGLGRQSDEASLVEALLSAPALEGHLKKFGADVGALKKALPNARLRSIASVLRIVRGTVWMPPPKSQSEEKLFASFVRYGSEELKSALEAAGLRLGDFMFYLAHGQAEKPTNDLPHDNGNGWAVRIVNDNYSPMEFVVGLLGKRFQLERAEAIKIMLKIHHEGSQDIPCAQYEKALEAAQQINAEARQQRIPLYAKVVAQQRAPRDGPRPAGSARP